MEPRTRVIGVDGGGTKTLAWLAELKSDCPPIIVGRGSAGPANPCAVGQTAAVAAIREAIDSAFADADQPVQTVAAACFSIAGTGPVAERRGLEDWIDGQIIADQIQMSNDAEPILACLPERWGVALISGTGSFALGRSLAGTQERAGGWGYLVGDEGSGYAIAIEALRSAFRSVDGRGPETAMLPALLAHLGVFDASSLVSHLYAAETDRRRIADLAPVVLEIAESGDPVAGAVVAGAAHGLTELVLTLNTRLALQQPVPLAVAGGVLVRSERIRRLVAEELHSAGVETQIQIVAEPVRGAVELAASAALARG